MSLVEFAAAITARLAECKFALQQRSAARQAPRNEGGGNRRARFEFDRNNPERVKAVRKAVAFFEGDGWMATTGTPATTTTSSQRTGARD